MKQIQVGDLFGLYHLTFHWDRISFSLLEGAPQANLGVFRGGVGDTTSTGEPDQNNLWKEQCLNPNSCISWCCC